MSYSAVIFDLFGTLIPDITGPPYERIAAQMAKVLSVPVEPFIEMWFGSAYERNAGKFETIQDNIRYVCRELNVPVEEKNVQTAASIRYDFVHHNVMSPRNGSLETINQLKKMGVKVGLISDCSPSEPVIWQETRFRSLFDTTIFSSSVKLKKPDPKIYQLAVATMKVRPQDCIYVGNGGNNEISGAYESGMFPVLILPEKNAGNYSQPGDEVKEFSLKYGKIIEAINEVLVLI